MQKFYVDAEGKCVGSYDGPAGQSPFAGTPIGIAPADADGQRWNGSAWGWRLEIARGRKVAAIRQRLDQALASVVCPLANNRPVQLDKDSQGNIGDATQQATVVKASAGAVTWPARMMTRGWRLADNSWYPLATPDDMITLGLWAAHAVEQRRDIAWSHIDAVRALTDPAAVEAYDIETGW